MRSIFNKFLPGLYLFMGGICPAAQGGFTVQQIQQQTLNMITQSIMYWLSTDLARFFFTLPYSPDQKEQVCGVFHTPNFSGPQLSTAQKAVLEQINAVYQQHCS